VDSVAEAETQSLLAQLESSESRRTPGWQWPLVVTVALDVASLAALWIAYAASRTIEAASGFTAFGGILTVKILLFVLLTQVPGIAVIRRTRHPWALPAWAFVLFGFACFAAYFGVMAARSIGMSTT
jgi:uncharacterized membrane protein YhaH (DUF805 family)